MGRPASAGFNTVSRGPAGKTTIRALPEGKSYWVVGCTNATEQALGKYSMMSTAVSVQPIRTLWKTNVLGICKALKLPPIVEEMARIPDCLCGRDEVAAAHIELIDDILADRLKPSDHDPALLDQIFGWVADVRRTNGFKQRTPYTI